MEIKHRCCYKLQRKDEYPDLADQLDAVFHLAVQLQADGVNLPPQTAAWVAQLADIKERNPKE